MWIQNRLLAAFSTLVMAVVAAGPAQAAKPIDPPRLGQLEQRAHARLGVVAIDTGTGRTVAHRAGERFAFASTGKLLSAGVLLKRSSDAQLDRVVRWKQSDVVANSPVTDDFVATGLALRHVLNASLVWSDNTAANVIARELGGPSSVQRGVRGLLGDATTRIDRIEPELNTAVPGDPRDTTTPRAMAADARKLLLGRALSAKRRTLLQRLMITNTTGDATIRAGVPKSWTVADKTGTAEYGTRNDVGVVWPRRGRPIVIVVFSTHTDPKSAADNALVAAATRASVAALR